MIEIAPVTSKRRASSVARLSLTNKGTSTSARTPIGTLTKKIHFQPAYWVRTPPSRTPIAEPEPAIPPRMPSALFRSEPSAKVTVVIEKHRRREDRSGGALSRRKTISSVGEVESPHSRENVENAGEADHEHAPAAEDVAQAAAEQDQAAVGQARSR